MDLVFHIGLPKTASTLKQKKIFTQHPSYNENFISPVSDDLKSSFRDLVMDNKKKKSHYREWANRVYELHKKQNNSSSCIVHSDEGVCEYRYGNSAEKLAKHPFKIDFWGNYRSYTTTEPPILPFLNQFSTEAWPYGDVRVILTVRNQASWLASYYAQISNKILNASQKDFEKQVNRIIDSNDIYMDWSLWIEQLQKIVGQKNLCVLLLEDIKTDSYWDDLLSFIDLDRKNVSLDFLGNGEKVNKRKKDSYSWKIRSSKSITKYLFNHYWPESTAPALRQKAVDINKKNGSYVDPLYRSIFDRKRGKKIRMTDELKNKIKNYTNPFNRKLEELLDRDLKHLGY